MSPEYAMRGMFSEKSDVYSFGVLLLEIVSGKKNNNFHYRDEQLSLIAHVSSNSPILNILFGWTSISIFLLIRNIVYQAWQLWSECRELDLIDEVLADSYSSSEVVRCIEVGLLCAQDHPTDRPTMPEVVFMLSNESDRPKPKRPSFFNESSLKRDLRPQIGTKFSTNGVTVSMIEGRW